MTACLRWLGVLCLCWLPAALALAPLGDPYFETVGDAQVIPDNNITALVVEALAPTP